MIKRHYFIGSALVGCIAAMSSPAFAQVSQAEVDGTMAETGPARNDTEIVVTARKVGEKIQDIPLSINAFSDVTLERRDITNLDALAKAAPGISLFQGNDRAYGVLTFRGMRNNSNFDSTRENSSIFIDGVYYIGTPANLNFDDVQRVEIVKGPQSAFFGRSTFGGAINFITKTPRNELHASAFVRAATYNHYEARASIEGPLVSDILAVRVNGRYESFGGMYKNVLTGDQLGKQKTASVSGTVSFTPTPELNIRGSIAHVQQDDGPPAAQLIGRRPTHNCTVSGQTRYCGLLRFSGDAAIAPVTPQALPKIPEPGFHRKFTNMSLTASYDLGGGYAITSLTGYQHEQLTNVDNFTHSADDVYGFSNARRQSATSEELRITSPQDARLRVLAGLYYIRQNYFSDGLFIYGTQNPFAGFVGGPGALTAPAPVTKQITNKAVFGSVAFDLTSELTRS
uniref:TonB-dependent receptor n=1 Tax=Novosphingobium sp. TaxID=1874826 RepID=UPI00356B4483